MGHALQDKTGKKLLLLSRLRKLGKLIGIFMLPSIIAGVILIHLISSLPYCITIMTDATRALGPDLEEQAIILGANPLVSVNMYAFNANAIC